MKSDKHSIAFVFLFFLQSIAISGYAQEEEEELITSGDKRGSVYYGINLGASLANKYTAPYYNGTGNGRYTVFDLIANSNVYNQIYNYYHQNFEIGQLPANPKYRVGLAIGGNVGVYINESTAIYANADFLRLNVAEVMTVYTPNNTNPSGDPVIHEESVTGKEQRFNLDLGLHFDFGANEAAMGYFELGGDFNAVKATQNSVHFGNLSYNLLLQNNPNVSNHSTTGGASWGFVTGTGVRLRFNQKVSFDLGTSAYFQKINLYQDQKLRLNPVIYLRIVYN